MMEYRFPYEKLLKIASPMVNEKGTGSCARVPLDHDPKKSSTGGMEAAMGKKEMPNKERM